MKFFKKNLEDVFIESEIKAYQIDKDNKLFLEKLSDLYQSPEYKVFSQLISNRAKGLAMQGMRLNYSNDKELCIPHSFLRGQIFATAYILKMIKQANYKYQNMGNKNDARNGKV